MRLLLLLGLLQSSFAFSNQVEIFDVEIELPNYCKLLVDPSVKIKNHVRYICDSYGPVNQSYFVTFDKPDNVEFKTASPLQKMVSKSTKSYSSFDFYGYVYERENGNGSLHANYFCSEELCLSIVGTTSALGDSVLKQLQ
ncbi:hypothetical protein J1N51_07595 [Psychrosphaera ytuae]|uniref:Uncharacterized protein n=1 Tax=Psychrosphaera ytuae TaxID=2820710 RepID=A0A975D8U8_9GAMM|nr:hypothetical protein [Psychrosphaera ytuae]QTH62646.1 hypothetical protein J1N51_07595 [Psychrosphaera ytuae]